MDIDPGAIAYLPTTGARRVHDTALVVASEASLAGYGHLVDDAQACKIEIVRWPAQGWRPIDANSGDQGGVAEGLFEFSWKGETLFARNHAVGDSYLFGWSTWPEQASAERTGTVRERALIWRANYHPDGGQLFYPLNGKSFVVPLALPGDDVTPESFRDLLVRWPPRPVPASERVAWRGRPACRRGAVPRPAGARARARLGELRQGVRLLSRRATARAVRPVDAADPHRILAFGTLRNSSAKSALPGTCRCMSSVSPGKVTRVPSSS